jgi:hypothetical protein
MGIKPGMKCSADKKLRPKPSVNALLPQSIPGSQHYSSGELAMFNIRMSWGGLRDDEELATKGWNPWNPHD